MIEKLKHKYALSENGAKNMIKAFVAVTIANLVLMLPVGLLYQLTSYLLDGKVPKDKLGFYLGAGITVMMALQVILNVAVVTASMPATGITLPFVSYGGTSLLVFMASMGIMLNISKKNRG